MKTPFLGCAYYPEDWPDDQLGYDISMMKKAGITCARIGEFAWRKMEPVRGEYRFGWLHRVIDALAEAGISVVLGTPTATPPVWLLKQYPDVTRLTENGVRIPHGGRRHCCSNNPHYLEASDAIVEAMGREFGTDPNVIGWQLDNEIYTFDNGCVCEYCMENYRARLKKEYGTVEELNERWDLNLFSQAYDSFDEIPPAGMTWHNPHLRYEWKMAHHDADTAFMHRQAEILRRYTKAPIGTDMMPFNGLSYETMCAPLDVVMFNHYNSPSDISNAVFWFDHLRTVKDRPFWNTETATTWNGADCIGQVLKPEGWCRMNSWLPVALGGECNMYWLWRQHWAGHELTHGSVLSPEGRPVHVFGEVRQTAEEYEKASAFLSGTKLRSETALHFTSRSWNLFEQQAVVYGNHYADSVYAFHRSAMRTGLRPDVIGSSKALDGYRFLISPLVMTLEDGELGDRIFDWVEKGGVWLAGPMTDIRNGIGAHYTDRATGWLEKKLGVRLDYGVPTDGTLLKAVRKDGAPFEVRKWAELYTVPENAETLVSVSEGHSALKGETVVAKIPYGKGTVLLLGTFPKEEDLDRLIETGAKLAGVPLFEKTGDLVVAERTGAMEGWVVCETGYRDASFAPGCPVRDLLTGETFDAAVPVEPYGVRVLVREEKE